MTVALAVKVWDGIVLATDSATTLGYGTTNPQVYNHANKTFQLHRKYPIGAMTWGLGQVSSASISSLAKDFRSALMGDGNDASRNHWELGDDYEILDVTKHLVEFMYPLYQPFMTDVVEQLKAIEVSKGDSGDPDSVKPLALGMLVAGYSSDTTQGPQAFKVVFDDVTSAPTPEPVLQSSFGWVAYAQSNAVERLILGVDPRLKAFLAEGDFQPPHEAQVGLDGALQIIDLEPVNPAMPYQDAINFARFLADVSVGYSRWTMGPDTVGGAVEVAGISRHEGFKWVNRKHYYPSELNPERSTHGS